MGARWILTLVSLLGWQAAWAQGEFANVYDNRAPVVPAGLTCTYSATSATTMAAVAGGETLTFTFDETEGEASCNWTAVETDAFNMITFGSPGFGTGTGSFSLDVVVAANSGSARSAMVQITNTRGDPLDFTINQAAGTCTYSVSDGIAPITSRNFESVGGSGTVTMTTQTGCSWDVSNLMPASGCISITSPSLPTTGTGSLSYTVAALGAMDPARSCTMDFTGDGAFSQTYTIMQSAITCDYSLDSAASAVLPDAGGTNVDDVVLTVTPSGCAWTVSANMPWITPVPTSGTTTDTIDISLTANTGPSNRSGTLTFLNGSSGVEETYTVTQAGQGCSPSVGPTSSSLGSGSGGSSFNVTVGAGCGWTTSAVSTGNFVTVTPPGTGTGNGTVNFTVAANAGNARAGTITVTADDGTANHTVNQAGVGCSISVTPGTQSVPSGGNPSLQATVIAGTGCAWTVSDNQPWITPTTTSGSGNGTVFYAAASNPLTSPRGGSLIVTLTSNAQSDSVNVSQAGVGCAAFSVSTSTLDFTAVAPPSLSAPVTITGTPLATCTWTTSESASWLTITPASGNGLDDTFTTVTVDPNPNPMPRSTVITIAGNPVTVTQAEQQCIFTLNPTFLDAVATGESATITVTTADPTCTWTAESNVPWFNLTQAGLVGNNVLLIDDQIGFGLAAAVLTADAHTVTELQFEAFFGYPNLQAPGFLAGFDIIVWAARGTDFISGSAFVPPAVVTNLENYIQAGGHLLVTGLNSLVSPNLQVLVRSSTFGDRVSFDPTWNTAATDNFILNGPYGDYRSLSFVASGYDDDDVTADTGAGAQALVTNPSGDRIIFTDLPDPAGSVGYWNGGEFDFGNAQPDFSDGGNPQNIFRNWVCGIGTCAIPGGTGSGTVDYTVDPNDGLSERSGTADMAGNVFPVDQAVEPSFLINEVRTADRDGFEIINIRSTPVNLSKLGLAVTGVFSSSFGFGDLEVLPGFILPITFGTTNVWNPGEPGSLTFFDNESGNGVDMVRWAGSNQAPTSPDTFSGSVIAPMTKAHGMGRDMVSTDSNDDADWCIQFPSDGAVNNPCLPPVMVNEVFPGTPDYFEIYNFSTGTVDVTNWIVETTGTSTNTPVLTGGRVLSAGEYVRIEEFSGRTVFPGSCSFSFNPVNNCSFENGLSGWIVSDASLPFFAVQTGGAGISPPPEFGLFSSDPTDEFSALLNGFDADDVGGTSIQVAQDLTVPLDKPVLFFEYRAGWDLFNFCPPPECIQDRRFRVEVQPAGGGAAMQSSTILIIADETIVGDTGNNLGIVDLAAFAGTSVRIAFVWDVPEQSSGPAFFQLDNVSINSVPPGTILTGGNISWVTGGVGSVTLSDDMGGVVDFLRWGGSPTVPPGQPGPPWTGDAPTTIRSDDAIGRSVGSIDSNAGEDWCVQRSSTGEQNPLCDGEVLLRTGFEDNELPP